MRPGPWGLLVTAGETTCTGVSSSLKMRSLAAMADCRMLYFSLKSMMGRKKRRAYWMKATSTPSVAAVDTRRNAISVFQLKLTATLVTGVLRITSPPPNQITQAIAMAERISTTG